MFVGCECCVLSVRDLCDRLITRPEESYRLLCVVVCDLENLKNEEAMTRVGWQSHRKKKKIVMISSLKRARGRTHAHTKLRGVNIRCSIFRLIVS
jgi:hypothetical protein